MKKTTVSISYDEEIVKALSLYLAQKDSSVEAELQKAVEALYLKTVPANVREFLGLRSGAPAAPAQKRNKAPSAVATEPADREEAEEEAEKEAVGHSGEDT